MQIGNICCTPLTNHAQHQIARMLHMPVKFHDFLKENHKGLLRTNLNELCLHHAKNCTIRTLDGSTRAVLGANYWPRDNFPYLDAALPVIEELGLTIVSCELTENAMYIKAISTTMKKEVRKGDVVQMGIILKNNEIGLGSILNQTFIKRCICDNGMVVEKPRRRYHVHRHSDDSSKFYSATTHKKDDEAFWHKMRDTIRGSFSEGEFNRVVRKFVESTEVKTEGDPVKVMDSVGQEFRLLEQEEHQALINFVQDGDFTKYGLANAITKMSQTVGSYDRATELEKLGGDIIEMPKTAWSRLMAGSKK